MVELNRKALTLHQQGKAAAARDVLMQAVTFGKEKGLSTHQAMARTYLHLGSVFFLGLKDEEKSRRYLELAVKLRPDIQLTPALSSPELEALLAQAGGKPKAAAPAAAAAPPPKPAPDTEEPPRPTADEDRAIGREEIYCAVPDEGPPGLEMLIRCSLGPRVKATAVTLHYRQPGAETYTSVPMAPGEPGWHVAKIPAAATTGKAVQWYVEATGPEDRTWNAGRYELPNVVLLRPGASAVGSGPVERVRREDEAPLFADERAREEAAAQARLHRRPEGRFFFGLALGSGQGFHPRRKLELRRELDVGGGVSPASLGHLGFEVGLQWSERLAFALQTRHQHIPEDGSGDSIGGSPKSSAHAVFAKVYYTLHSWTNTQLFGSGVVGGGSGFRLAIAPQPDQGLPRSDTIRGGPIVLGPGIGVIHHFHRRIAALVEARVLAGAPDLAAVAELNLGVQLAF
jgi:hypothetical protein